VLSCAFDGLDSPFDWSYDLNELKLARRFALAGFLISILFFLFWRLEDKFNFFHLPTVENAPPGNYTEPASRALLEKLNFVLCPPLVITVFGMDLGATSNLVLWTVSLVLNTALYFIVGLMVGLLRNKLTHFRKAPKATNSRILRERAFHQSRSCASPLSAAPSGLEQESFWAAWSQANWRMSCCSMRTR
jgi:hypothetical protein